MQFGVNSSPICIVNRITRNGLFTLPLKLIPSSMFAVRCFNVCIAFSTVPFPVCIWGGAIYIFGISVFAAFPTLFGNERSSFIGFNFFGYSVQVKIA